MLLALATRRLRFMAHVGLSERVDESVQSMAADLGGWVGWWSLVLGVWWGAVYGGEKQSRTALFLGGRACLCYCSQPTDQHLFSGPPAAPLLPAGLNLSGPAYQYTSANGFSYDTGAADDEGEVHCWGRGCLGLPGQLVGLAAAE